MSKMKAPSKVFRENYLLKMGAATDEIRVICESLDRDLEFLAVSLFGKAEDCSDSTFCPPEIPVRVKCWHCGDKYSSAEIKAAYRPRMQEALSETVGNGFSRLDPLWWCKNDDCDGAGFGHDIHEIIKARKPKAGAA